MCHNCDGIGNSNGDGIAGRVGKDKDHNDFNNYNNGRKSGGDGQRQGNKEDALVLRRRPRLRSI